MRDRRTGLRRVTPNETKISLGIAGIIVSLVFVFIGTCTVTGILWLVGLYETDYNTALSKSFMILFIVSTASAIAFGYGTEFILEKRRVLISGAFIGFGTGYAITLLLLELAAHHQVLLINLGAWILLVGCFAGLFICDYIPEMKPRSTMVTDDE